MLRLACNCILQVRSRFAAGGGSSSEDFRPFLAGLQQLGFKLVKQDASNRMFVVFVLKKQQAAAPGAAAGGGIKWPPLKACVYKKR
jgi:ribosomal RNA-processing protein 8